MDSKQNNTKMTICIPNIFKSVQDTCILFFKINSKSFFQPEPTNVRNLHISKAFFLEKKIYKREN